MNSSLMEHFSGLSEKAEEAGFLVAYPNGTGPGNILLTWNAGPFFEFNKKGPDDVAFLGKVLDDAAVRASVDTKRVYVTGMSNGAMMAYRLAAEMSDRIAAIAPVAGVALNRKPNPSRPVPVIAFHGTKDALVPFTGPADETGKYLQFPSVDDTVALWARIDGCAETPTVAKIPSTVDKLQVTRKSYAPGKNGLEVVLYVVEGGGHTWPGRQYHAAFLGESTANISANDLMWAFFQKYSLK